MQGTTRRPWTFLAFGRIVVAAAMLLLALALPAQAAKKGAKHHASQRPVEAAWTQVRAALDQDAKPEAFDKAFRQLLIARDAEGIANLEAAGMVLAQKAVEALDAGADAAADRYAAAAIEVAPQAPEGYLVRSNVHWYSGQYPTAFEWFAKGAVVGMQHYWVGVTWVAYGVVVFWLASATTLLLLLVPGIVRTIKVMEHRGRELSRFRAPSWLLVGGCVAVLAMPVAAGLKLGWVVLIWSAFTWLGDPSRERKAQAVLLIVVLLVPFVLSPLFAVSTPRGGSVGAALEETAGGAFPPPVAMPQKPGEGTEVRNWLVPFALGNQAVREARYADGVAWYELSLKHGGDKVRINNNIAAALFKAGKVREAEHMFSEVAGTPQAPVETMFNLAKAQAQRFDFAAQRATIARAQSADPEGFVRVTAQGEKLGDGFVYLLGTSSNETRMLLLTETNGWHRFVAPLWRGLFAGVTPLLAPGLLVLILVLFTFVPRLLAGREVYDCDVCGVSTCHECMKFDHDMHLCGGCSEKLARTDGREADILALRGQFNRTTNRVGKVAMAFIPGARELTQGRYAVAGFHLMVVGFTLWWIGMLGTIPEWALGVSMQGWPAVRAAAAGLLLVYLLLAFMLLRMLSRRYERNMGGRRVLAAAAAEVSGSAG